MAPSVVPSVKFSSLAFSTESSEQSKATVTSHHLIRLKQSHFPGLIVFSLFSSPTIGQLEVFLSTIVLDGNVRPDFKLYLNDPNKYKFILF